MGSYRCGLVVSVAVLLASERRGNAACGIVRWKSFNGSTVSINKGSMVVQHK